MMDEIAPSLMQEEENKTKAWYITKKITGVLVCWEACWAEFL